MKGNFIFIFILSGVLILFLVGCTRDIGVRGCISSDATNHNSKANIDDGSCKFRSPIYDPSFENGGTLIKYNNGNYCGNGSASNLGDGFMPTEGTHFFKITPYENCSNVTNRYVSFFQGVLNAKHFKGFYFDYSYKGLVGSNNILNAQVWMTYPAGGTLGTGPTTNPYIWSKTIYLDGSSSNSSSNVLIQKRDEYCELPYGEFSLAQFFPFYINAKVSSGTFTFQIDNIRVDPR